jgi:nucleoside-diphosphate kinase
LLLENSFEIIAEKKYQVSREIAWRHYEEHIWKFKPWYEESVYDFTRRYLSSWYSYWIVFYWENAVVKWREILTEIRTKYLVNPKVARYNMTHASDSEAGAKREIQIHFPDFEF